MEGRNWQGHNGRSAQAQRDSLHSLSKTERLHPSIVAHSLWELAKKENRQEVIIFGPDKFMDS